MVCFKFLSVMALRFPLGLYLSSISSSASYKQLAQLCCCGSQWTMAWKLLLRQFHHFIKESGTIAGKGFHLFFPSNQYHYCSCCFKIFAFELKYWACWPNNNSFKDTEVKLAALHMYFDTLISTCTVSCAVHLLTCRSESNTHHLTSLLTTCFDVLISSLQNFHATVFQDVILFFPSIFFFFPVCFLKHQTCVQVWKPHTKLMTDTVYITKILWV